MIKIHNDLVQGSQEWLDARCGLLTASEMKLILTPTLKMASNDKERAHLYEIVAQRITGYTEPQYISDDMIRGKMDEVKARMLYAEAYDDVEECGFITNSAMGYTVGYSPDGLVGDDGLIEIKSRRQKYQIETILNNTVPDEYILQLQSGLMFSGRKWIDFISYSAGLPMKVIRVEPDKDIQEAIVKAATAFESRVTTAINNYKELSKNLIPTERETEMEITL